MSKATRSLSADGSKVRRRERKIVLAIAVSWTIVDYLFFLWRKETGLLSEKYYSPDTNIAREVLLRELNVFVISLIIGYFLVVVLRNYLRNSSLWYNLFIKTLILIGFAFIMNVFIYITYEWLIAGRTLNRAFERLADNVFRDRWLLKKMPEWIILFIGTMLAIEVNEKYSRGVFLNIMLGKYLQPLEERRIIMFLDLKDSTPIAERLGSKEYFKFIRDFIHYISAGLMEQDGRIYQYVGDEIVVWWPESKANARKAVDSLLTARKHLHKQFDRFKRSYDTFPEYKAGIHAGMVTVGQVGIVKKDLVMSGDAINTAARIRTACTETNHKYLVSKDIVDLLSMEDWQAEPIGPIELKGKNEVIELFALKI